MKKYQIKKGKMKTEELDAYYSKLNQISEILLQMESTIYYRISELLRGKEIDQADLKISTHKQFVRNYLTNNSNKNNEFLIDFFNSLRDTICATYNPSASYFDSKRDEKPYSADKKINKRIQKYVTL